VPEIIRGLATLLALALMKKVERDRKKAVKRKGKKA
jgi:hypothetical protein